MKKAFYALARKYHPDTREISESPESRKQSSEPEESAGNTREDEIFKRVNQAYEILGNQDRRY